jgi:pullulanase
MQPDIITRKETHFVLWRPAFTDPIPSLVIGIGVPGNPPALNNLRTIELIQNPQLPELWELDSRTIGLVDGQVYHYWFKVKDSLPEEQHDLLIEITDPFATTVDWRFLSTALPAPYDIVDRDPASVIMYADDRLWICDAGGETGDWTEDPMMHSLPPNNNMVIYELPTRWSDKLSDDPVDVAVGTFQDVRALVEAGETGANFEGMEVLRSGDAYLKDLGINALELLPPADSFVSREWGYATSNYLAADYDLGFPESNASPTATSDLVALITSCHKAGIRFIPDVVMAFATHAPMENLNFPDFHVKRGSGDPEEGSREDFGGKLLKYNYRVNGYDPITGSQQQLVPSRQWMKSFLSHWMLYYRVDGIRMDSVVNFNNWDFIKEFKDLARAHWRDRWNDQNSNPTGAEERFLVIGEELAMPMYLIYENRLDALWNEGFQSRLRSLILGGPILSPDDFLKQAAEMMDCRKLGFRDGSQAINYITSHDVEGFRKERLYNFLENNGVAYKDKQIRLAFVCLLTAVGVPMILAGEEFADEHDLLVVHPHKQIDPVNFHRKEEPWRNEIFKYVSRLVHFRTSAVALSVNDTSILHRDLQDGRRIVVWQRGMPGSNECVVVVANFSAWGTENPESPSAEYRIPGWPLLPQGRQWKEITQDRIVSSEWAGREPLYPWEAKVYAMVAG